MKWSTTPPKKDGWYLVTVKDGIVMPAYRMEYPKGNFTWQRLACGAEVWLALDFQKHTKEAI